LKTVGVLFVLVRYVSKAYVQLFGFLLELHV